MRTGPVPARHHQSPSPSCHFIQDSASERRRQAGPVTPRIKHKGAVLRRTQDVAVTRQQPLGRYWTSVRSKPATQIAFTLQRWTPGSDFEAVTCQHSLARHIASCQGQSSTSDADPSRQDQCSHLSAGPGPVGSTRSGWSRPPRRPSLPHCAPGSCTAGCTAPGWRPGGCRGPAQSCKQHLSRGHQSPVLHGSLPVSWGVAELTTCMQLALAWSDVQDVKCAMISFQDSRRTPTHMHCNCCPLRDASSPPS